MGRMVWFGPPLVASGFGLPAAAVIGIGVAVIGAAVWIGRKTAPKPNEAPSG